MAAASDDADAIWMAAVSQEMLDITTLAQPVAEQVLRQAQKSEAIGQLVADIVYVVGRQHESQRSAGPARAAGQGSAPHAGICHGRCAAGGDPGQAAARHRPGTRLTSRSWSRCALLPAASRASSGKACGRAASCWSMTRQVRASLFADPHSIEPALMILCINGRDASERSGPIAVAFAGCRFPMSSPVQYGRQAST